MPNEGAMAQLSRPYQIGLAAIALLAVAWLLLVQGHSSNTSSPGSATPPTATTRIKDATAPTPAATAKAAAPTKAAATTHHSSASAVGTHSKATAKTHRAASTSHKTAQPSSATTTHTHTSAAATAPAAKKAPATKAPGATSTHSSSSPTTASTKTSAPAKTKPATPGSATKSASTATREAAVEAALKRGQTALILFWNPKAADDDAIHQAVRQVGANRSLHVFVQEASAGEVADFGTITRGVQVYGTPTLLVVNKSGQTLTLTGVQPAYAIEQAIQESQHS